MSGSISVVLEAIKQHVEGKFKIDHTKMNYNDAILHYNKINRSFERFFNMQRKLMSINDKNDELLIEENEFFILHIEEYLTDLLQNINRLKNHQISYPIII